jgi:hypothetical protein
MTSIYMSFQKEQNEKWKYTSYRSNSGSVLFSLVPFGNNSNMKRASFL